MRRGFQKNKKSVDIDEIFLDVRNAPGYHSENLEGVLEKPISSKIFIIVGFIFLVVGSIFLFRLGFLQIKDGDLFRLRSDRNRLRFVQTESGRGVIYDRTGMPLASNILRDISDNSTTTSVGNFKLLRRYPENGFLHVLGYLRADVAGTKGTS